MIKYFKKSIAWAFAVTTGIFTFVPETFFEKFIHISQSFLNKFDSLEKLDARDINIIISRVLCFLIVWLAVSVIYMTFKGRRITIKGRNYSIRVEYGNILKKEDCMKVINFDECYTTKVGYDISDVKPSSICGQYLSAHPNIDMEKLIKDANVTPARAKSKYKQKVCYALGTIVPNGDDLLMAFAKLDEKGRGHLSYDEYLKCLNMLWSELENHYSEKDICVPILGSGRTVFNDGSGTPISKQELLNVMIWSYNLTPHKIKLPHKLRIICKCSDDFSIHNINK